MLKTAFVIVISLSALFFISCGSECGGICGSECELLDCSYDVIECDLYAAPNHGVIIHYRKLLEGGGYNWTAKIFIDLEGVSQVEGLLLEGQEFMDKVQLSRPGGNENWHEYTGKDCVIDKGGDEAGKEMAGQCNFSFVNGYFATFNFSCDLVAVD
jgi:hypothetical protein